MNTGGESGKVLGGHACACDAEVVLTKKKHAKNPERGRKHKWPRREKGGKNLLAQRKREAASCGSLWLTVGGRADWALDIKPVRENSTVVSLDEERGKRGGMGGSTSTGSGAMEEKR